MEKIMICELSPIDGRKSFYGKAKVYRDGENLNLISYNTCVLSYNPEKSELTRHWCGYSATTMRHVKSFLYFCGIPWYGKGKSWWDSLPIDTHVKI